MCIDYRALNNITAKNKYPSPRIDDLLGTLSGTSRFTSLDLASGYHQLRLDPSDMPETAFNTHMGEWVACFAFWFDERSRGLSAGHEPCVPRAFEQMGLRLSGWYSDLLQCYIGKSEEEHLMHIESSAVPLRAVDWYT
jgi:hypothetical protein